MSLRQFTDNANATLAAGISSGATSLSVTSGEGSLFPTITGSQYFVATLIKAATPTTFEIIKVTGRSGDSFTSIVRAQEGTTALSWNAGDTCALLITAGDCAVFAQFDDLQEQSINYAGDSGSANAYVIGLTPSFATHQTGMPIRWVAAHSNTGASTFNDGGGAAALVTEGGGALVSGNIVAGNMYETIWNGTNFTLMGTVPSTFTQLAGSIANAQVPSGAVTQWAATLFASAALTGTPTAPTAANGTATTQIATTAFVNPASSTGTNGYIKFANGLILQWGYAQGSGTSPAIVVVTFPIAFPNAWLAGYCTTYRSTAGAAGSNFISSPSNSGMNCLFDALDGESNVLNGGYWLAIGH
jgi:hypothetical protein